jgi:DNA-binding response OmpR family regulator
MKHLLLVEDDKMISKTLSLSLHYRGFQVTLCENALEAKKALSESQFDIAILDVNLPDESGFSLCRWIRENDTSVPIVMLTAQSDESSAVKGIESGADDYVRKPFGLEELTVRLNRLLGRKTTDLLSLGLLKMSLKQRQVWIGELPLALSKREFDILRLLLEKPGEVITREAILTELNDDGELLDRTIDSHLSHLRKKIKEAGGTDVQITPVYGVGYRLENK